eukprot:3303844-Pleurochrysis_carterae.AAC.2
MQVAGQLAPHLQRAFGTLDPHHSDDWVIRIHVHKVKAVVSDVRVGLVAQADAVPGLAPSKVSAGGISAQEGRVNAVHVLAKEVEYRIAESLRDVRGG